MNIAKNHVVSFHYELKVEGHTVEDSRQGGDGSPMEYLHGFNNIIPGLESALEGRSAGESFEATVEPGQGYGEYDPKLVLRLPIKKLKPYGAIRPGEILNLPTEQGMHQVRVIKAGRFNADVDGNHPLAGRALNFSISIENIRAASEKEIEHGHVHSTDSACETDSDENESK